MEGCEEGGPESEDVKSVSISVGKDTGEERHRHTRDVQVYARAVELEGSAEGRGGEGFGKGVVVRGELGEEVCVLRGRGRVIVRHFKDRHVQHIGWREPEAFTCMDQRKVSRLLLPT